MVLSSLCAACLPAMATSNRLGLEPSDASRDYVANRTQFQLHTLLTEQRHPKTFELSDVAAGNVQQALSELFSVDEDVTHAFAQLADDPRRMASLHAASSAVQKALREGHRVYFYGTGSTGRLSETLESGLWRPFCEQLSHDPAWGRIQSLLPGLADRVRGEITGGDRALISSLEGFEDLPLIGALQLRQDGIGPDDVVFAVTEGGETSAVIGTALAAADQIPGRSDRVWFVYNNPDAVLRPFDRSRRVLDDARIGKISIPTGPQAITGSTRMQATTTSLFLMGLVLEDALRGVLLKQLDTADAQRIGLSAQDSIESRLKSFASVQRAVAASAPTLAEWTTREAEAYRNGHHATYLAQKTLMPVFVDVTERAPTFRLAPLDRIDTTPARSWIRVWAPVATPGEAWQALLHRPFQGLDVPAYQDAFEHRVTDPALRETALRSLKQAGSEQQSLYDLSWSEENRRRLPPERGDIGALLLYADEPLGALQKAWLDDFDRAGSDLVTVVIGHDGNRETAVKQTLARLHRPVPLIAVDLPSARDPLGLDRTLALKMLLNAHSTAVMARLGRTVGNTMTAVQPGNLKLIGRATFLIQSHVNAVLDSAGWRKRHGNMAPLDYAEANAVLFEAIRQRAEMPVSAQVPEVELAIVATLNRLATAAPLDWTAAAGTLKREDLNAYLRQAKAP